MADGDDPPSKRDLVEALRFSHAMEMQTKLRLVDVAATVDALVGALAARGLLSPAELQQHREPALAREDRRARNEALVVLGDDTDKYDTRRPLPAIDCEARIPLCKARCCSMSFALSPQDLDEGVVRWDYGRPYHIRQRDDGWCVHNVPGTCRCTVYAQRPLPCRTYDCRGDRRIWLDFDLRIPAPPEE